MDEDAFRHALGSVNPQPCAFEKSILARRCNCIHISKYNIAEREVVACSVPEKRKQCRVLLELLRINSTFALKLAHISQALSHAQELKVQCGGLIGLQLAVNGQEEVSNISELIEAADHKFGNMENFPYSQIVQSVASCKLRQRAQKE
jgi:hypothetical protein